MPHSNTSPPGRGKPPKQTHFSLAEIKSYEAGVLFVPVAGELYVVVGVNHRSADTATTRPPVPQDATTPRIIATPPELGAPEVDVSKRDRPMVRRCLVRGGGEIFWVDFKSGLIGALVRFPQSVSSC